MAESLLYRKVWVKGSFNDARVAAWKYHIRLIGSNVRELDSGITIADATGQFETDPEENIMDWFLAPTVFPCPAGTLMLYR